MGVAARFLAVAAAAASLVASPARAAGNAVDVFGHPINTALRRNEPKLILYTNAGTGSSITDPAKLMAARLRDVPFITVVHVDLRGMPEFLLGLVRQIMQGSQQDGNAPYAELARAAGLKPPNSEDRLRLVMEPDGAAHESLGLARGFQQAMAVVLDRSGKEVLRAPFPQEAAAVEKALNVAGRAKPAASPPLILSPSKDEPKPEAPAPQH